MSSFTLFTAFSCYFLSFLSIYPTLSSAQCSATLQNGVVNGFSMGTVNPQKNICAYTSIPFATPPIGRLRFQAPTPAKDWGTLNATRLPNWCPQGGSPPQGVKIMEDCLYLNVYQPMSSGNDTEGLPVMIWFHGGSFTSGSSYLYTPEKLLARADVILVVIHYRLGLLGFLSTGDYVVPGNNGLKDQAFSIRWVNKNIKAFGGNPSRVTIFGQSAGGASVVYQYISPLNKGLIQGAIAQSGTALASWAIDKNPSESSKTMAKLLLCPTITNTMMVNCLRNLPWQNIINAQKIYTFVKSANMTYPHATMTPVVEPSLPGAFITAEPEAIMRNGDIPDIPLVIGATKHDGSFILGGMYLIKIGPLKLDKNPKYMKQEIVPDILKYVGVQDQNPGSRVVASSVELTFLSGVNRSCCGECLPCLVDVLTVVGYKSPIQNTAEILSGRGRKVYLYSFEHHSNNSLWPLYFQNASIPVTPGITHADDLLYLFNLPAKFSPQDQSFSELYLDMWTNFGRFGNPTPTPDMRFENWITYNGQDESFQKLNGTPTVQRGYRNSWRPNGFLEN